MSKRKICIVTGSRAEYGLLYWIIKGLHDDNDIDLQLCVTGMHLSPEFGLTYKQIEKDGFHINKKIEILLSSDSPVGISKSMGLGMISFSEAFFELKPDLILLLGDRFEIFSVAASAMVCRIPIAHIHGGETTEGAFDESIRHSITKMSHLHFTTTEAYRNRVIQLGEKPVNVYNTGAPGIESVRKMKLLDKEKLEKALSFKFNKKNLLVTFHPVTLEASTASEQFSELLSAIDELEDTGVIFTKPNADTDGRVIINMIDEYVRANSNKAVAFISMGHLNYLSALQFVDGMVGNSSSGLIEAPSFRIGTVNIGDRQKGRIKAESVIDCDPDKNSIIQAFKKLYSTEFLNILHGIKNPYGESNASEIIIPILKNFDLHNVLKKEFNNINF